MKKKPWANPDLAIAFITIDRMACQAGCVDTMQKNLDDLEGIRFAEVSYDKGEAVVVFIPTKRKTEKLGFLFGRSICTP